MKILPLFLLSLFGSTHSADSKEVPPLSSYKDRIRFIDPEKEAARREYKGVTLFAEESFSRERRAGKPKEQPPEPDKNITSQINPQSPQLPADPKLEAEIEELKNDLSKLQEDFAIANDLSERLSKENAQNKKRISALERSPGTPFEGWVWGQELGWVYASPLIAPYYFSQDFGWFFHEPGSKSRVVYKFNKEKWEEVNKNNNNNRSDEK